MNNMPNTESSPLCACGCGQPVRRASRTNGSRGIRKGEWGRYIRGHWGKQTGIPANLSATDRNEYMRQWRILNLEEVTRRQRANYQRLRRAVIEHYSAGKCVCACCGEAIFEFLTIDHIEANAKSDRLDSGTKLYSRLRAAGFPFGYQVLCFNCNCAKRDSGICPHQRVSN